MLINVIHSVVIGSWCIKVDFGIILKHSYKTYILRWIKVVNIYNCIVV